MAASRPWGRGCHPCRLGCRRRLPLRPIFLLGAGQPLFDLFDALFVGWMRAENCWCATAARLSRVLAEPLPETHRRLRIIASARHVNQAQMIRLRFLRATVRQHDAELCSKTVNGGG